MSIESSDKTSEKSFSQSSHVKKENIICKDGFCSLPSKNENPRINKGNINLFDPI